MVRENGKMNRGWRRKKKRRADSGGYEPSCHELVMQRFKLRMKCMVDDKGDYDDDDDGKWLKKEKVIFLLLHFLILISQYLSQLLRLILKMKRQGNRRRRRGKSFLSFWLINLMGFLLSSLPLFVDLVALTEQGHLSSFLFWFLLVIAYPKSLFPILPLILCIIINLIITSWSLTSSLNIC